MPNRAIALSLLALTACAVDPVMSTAEDALNCGSFCDPENWDEPQTLDFTFRAGRSMFPDSVVYGQPTCVDLGTAGHPHWACTVSIITTANPCGTIAVQCAGSRCNWQALDGCH